MSWWYLPTVFLPGVFTWAIMSFLLIERPATLRQLTQSHTFEASA